MPVGVMSLFPTTFSSLIVCFCVVCGFQKAADTNQIPCVEITPSRTRRQESFDRAATLKGKNWKMRSELKKSMFSQIHDIAAIVGKFEAQGIAIYQLRMATKGNWLLPDFLCSYLQDFIVILALYW